MGKLGDLVVGVSADASKFASEAMEGLNDAMPSIKKEGDTWGIAIGTAIGNGISSGISAIKSGIESAISGLVSIAEQGVKLSSELMATQLQTGVSAAALLNLKEAAASTGTSFDSLVTGSAKRTSSSERR